MATSQPSTGRLGLARSHRRPGMEQMLAQSASPNETDAAARVISETAHDLLAPLTSVREAIRLVRDGDLGSIAPGQQDCLSAAIDQCNCIDQMIGEMVQLERLRTGTPRANRSWVGISQIRRLVDESIRPWAEPRNIDVLWDLADEEASVVFADQSMIRRLIVNLVTNAIRASREGTCILIRLMRAKSDETICWTVIDQGVGISERDINLIADRQVSFAGGEGLGLSICRQLAAVHFSPLQIRSRLGVGTEVSFLTPASGPRSVASAWSRFRVAARIAQQGPLQKPVQRTGVRAVRSAAEIQPVGGENRVRLDPPSVAIEISHETTKPRCEDRLAAGVVTLGATVSREAADAFDQLLQSHLQMYELVYRTDTRRWVWVLDCDAHGIDNRITSITSAASAEIGGVRMAWSAPQMIPIDERRTESRIADLMVRESLAASTSSRVSDQNEVRLGSSPIVHSESAAVRLDVELRRLGEQMRGQTHRIRAQARSLRPNA
ncbi:sensor histidine kinase [Rubripirellula tenax]|uniref:sensor histidine kinase n=1 Tax=Rubripirellula tenax TaxID=2528015 RepID=UPI001648F4FD|nr:HAMP domain-containing sensor histidine kinase [Rubripirellula tenax]